MANKNKNSIPKHLIIFGIVLIILAIVFVFLIVLNNLDTRNIDNLEKTSEQNKQVLPENATENKVKGLDVQIFDPARDLIEVVENLDMAVATTVGSNLITVDGKVVNEKGQIVHNNALPMTDFAPKLSHPISPDSLLDGVIKIIADENGFSPSEFTIKSGEPVTISLTSSNVGSRLVFEDVSLIGLELPVPAGYTMSKTFEAPVVGTYYFYQDMPGRANQKGKMIVVEK